MKDVGVRELRQNLSVYLRRVKAGESLRVTEHGQPVALLSPSTDPGSAYERLVAEGRLLPPSAGPESLGPPLRVPLRMSTAEALDEQRRD